MIITSRRVIIYSHCNATDIGFCALAMEPLETNSIQITFTTTMKDTEKAMVLPTPTISRAISVRYMTMRALSTREVQFTSRENPVLQDEV